MNLKIIFKLFISIGIVFIIIGLMFKVLHRPGSEIYLQIGSALSLIFTLIALYEIVTSKKRKYLNKLTWSLCFILFNPITLLLYFFQRA